jgi:hypothetical protein
LFVKFSAGSARQNLSLTSGSGNQQNRRRQAGFAARREQAMGVAEGRFSRKEKLLMIALSHSTFVKSFISLLCAAALCGSIGAVRAADHGDAPNVAGDQAADLGDLYFFLDPNDNSKAVIILTVRGFIVPGEAVNFAIFDQKVRFVIEVENTGDARPDKAFTITFDERTADSGPPPRQILQVPRAQTATIRLPNNRTFTAPVLNPSLGSSPPPQPVTTDPVSGVSFFAGEVDDPFFFDIPAFGRFIASVRDGNPDPTVFNRARDTFAGYNILAMALRVPVSLIQGAGNVIGLDAMAQRRHQKIERDGEIKTDGPWRTLDRMANPAVNVALVPFNRKNEYNASDTLDDSRGKFANDIVATLTALGTSPANIALLASVAVTNGDFLRLDVTLPNSGNQGGTGPNGFPNGRRLADDVIDILLSIITNGALTTGDNVNANDMTFGNTFPFLAQSQQPRATGIIDDNTRN